ncbi:hypothetical protein EV359DRAFT_81388 [Lentinula novae-zelandiae]|nr:hypothetical protein EV359DRAFT_81388 [Lentinula novae-zelandiae]
MPRGKGKSVDFDLQDDELPFLGSQDSNGSNGSEDNAFQLAFAEQYIATREKKKKEQQRKFLAGAKKLVSKEIKSSAEVITETARSVDELFQAFTINYATEEDCIRVLWLAIVEEERKLQNLSKRFHSAVIKEGEECEAEQIKGMGKAQEAVLVRIFVLVYSSSNLSATRIDSQKSSERVAAGLKGTLKNPNVSEEAKDRATERLKDIGVEDREPVKVAPKTKVNETIGGSRQSEEDDTEFKPSNVLGTDPEDDEYEFKPVTADERDEELE